MGGDSWSKNQLLQILENQDYLQSLLERHQDIYGALQEIIDRFDVHPGEETGDLLHTLRLIWQEQYLESDYNLLCIMDDFLEEQKLEVTRPTWKRYVDSLQVFYNYLSEFGELDIRQLQWHHIEEFFSWWYLKHHFRPNQKELKGIFPTLKKFFHYVKKKKESYSDIWRTREAMELRKDVLRILDWETERPSFSQQVELGEDYGWESWFLVIMGLESKVGLLDISIGEKLMVQMEGKILEYLRIGDIFSATILSFDDELLVEDDAIYNLYPGQARPYIR